MSDWIVKSSNTARMNRAFSDEDLKKLVRSGNMSGLEMVRTDEAGGDWMPLHELPWFAEAAGAQAGDDLAALAKARKKKVVGRALKIIGGVYGGIGVFSYMLASPPGPQKGIAAAALIAGGLSVWLYSTVRKRKEREAKMASARAKTTAATPVADELTQALEALEKDLAGAPKIVRETADCAAIRRVIVGLQRQHQALSVMPDSSATVVELREELVAARDRLAKAPTGNAGLTDALQDEVRAIEDRLASVEATEVATIENAARRRGLLHELHALRMAIGRAKVDTSQEDSTIERLSELKRQLAREEEISESLEETTRAAASAMRARTIGPV